MEIILRYRADSEPYLHRLPAAVLSSLRSSCGTNKQAHNETPHAHPPHIQTATSTTAIYPYLLNSQ